MPPAAENFENDWPEEPNIIRSSQPLFKLPARSDTWSKHLADGIASRNPEHIALIDASDDTKLTYGQLHLLIQELSYALSTVVQKSDMILPYGENSLQYALMLLAATYLGVPAAPLPPANGPFELVQQMSDSHATVMILDREKIPVLLKAMNNPDYQTKVAPKIKLLVLINSDEQPQDIRAKMSDQSPTATIWTYKQVRELGAGHRLPSIPLYRINGDDHHLILYTSGTTGMPKGAIHSQYSWLASLMAEEHQHRMMEYNGQDNEANLMSYAMGHMSGNMFLSRILTCGGIGVIARQPSLEQLFQMVQKYRCAYVCFTPAMSIPLAEGDFEKRYDVSSLRFLYYGGSKTPSTAVDCILKKFPGVTVMELYGATEFFVAVRIQNFGQPECLPGNVGQPTAHCQMKIIDLDTGENLPAHQTGEACFRGPMRFVGYLNNEEATRATIDTNGWYHSGDIGYYDQYGALYIVDRIKEMIKYRGLSLIPAEIEDFIYRCCPDVLGVCVVGVKHRTDDQVPRAYIQLRPGSSETDIIEHIHREIRENLGHSKRLRGGIQVVPEIPRTVIGKVDRKYFKKLVQNELIDQPIADD